MMIEEKRCFKCHGILDEHDTHELQKRFTNGVEAELCGVCADGANAAMRRSREFYGIEKKAWKIVIARFMRKNGIPFFSRCNAMQNEMINLKKKSLLRLMFWMDIRAVKKYLNS